MYNALASKLSAKRAQFTIGQSLESLVRQRVTDPDTTTLLSWLKAISTGGMVSCEKMQMVLQKTCQGPSFGVAMSKEFQDRHRSLAEAVRTAVSASQGKWAFKTVANAQRVISRKRDLASFLLHARRVALSDAPSGLVSSF